MKVEVYRRDLLFKKPSRTSRDVLTSRPVWYIILSSKGRFGLGECAPVFGLSPESEKDIIAGIQSLSGIKQLPESSLFEHVPSLRFALEMALLNLDNNAWEWFGGDFFAGKSRVPINGLVWMNDADTMLQEAFDLVAQGFHCIKFKVGGLEFEKELRMLEKFREKFDMSNIEIRLDANGAFDPKHAESRLRSLSVFGIHSIEQPVKQQYPEVTAELAAAGIIPIALDEQLIGVHSKESKMEMLANISPQYIVIKPSLVGGFAQTLEWTQLAAHMGIGSWVTSMLESSVGLAAIAQWTSCFGTDMPQGLGTGSLYLNNLASPVEMSRSSLNFKPEQISHLNTIDEIQRSGLRIL